MEAIHNDTSLVLAVECPTLNAITIGGWNWAPLLSELCILTTELKNPKRSQQRSSLCINNCRGTRKRVTEH